MTLSAVGYEVSGAADGALYATTGLVGALVGLVAGIRALVTVGLWRRLRMSRLFWGAFGLLFLLVVPSFWSMVGSLHSVENAAPAAVRAVGRIPSYLSTYLFVFVAVIGPLVGYRLFQGADLG